MKRILSATLLLLPVIFLNAQQTPFEKSNGKKSATYFEAVKWYKDLDKNSPKISVKEMGPTDAGYPLHLVMISADGKFDPITWHQQKKAVLLINNGIHPGEPDGIDASMILVRDIVNNKIKLPENVALAFIPVYNIGGCLNRNSYTRANQNGPEEYGFRGNAQNLDLNRDFTKADSKEVQHLASTLDSTRVAIVLVAIDTNSPAAEITAFARGLGVQLPIYLAGEKGISDSFWGWGLPVSYLLDKQGHFIGRLRGPRSWDAPAVQAALMQLTQP